MNDAQALLKQYEPQPLRSVENAGQLLSARFSPSGEFLAAGGFDGRVRRWKTDALSVPQPDPRSRNKGPAVAEIPADLPPVAGLGGWVQAIAFHPSEDFLYAVDSWGRLHCSTYREEQPLAIWSVENAHDGWIRDVAVSPDGSLLATCGMDKTVRIWSARDGKILRELKAHDEDVFAVCFSPDGKALVSGDHKGVVRHWEPATGKEVRQFDASELYSYQRIQEVGGVRCLTFAAEGKTLLCGGTRPKNGGNVQGTPIVIPFDWTTGKADPAIELGKTSDVYVCDLQVHPDGFLLAVTSGNPGTGKLLFHRLGDGQPFFSTTKMANCHSVSLHPDGRRLAVVATSKGSNGNGRRVDKAGNYIGNTSPVHLLEMPDGKS